MILTRAHIAERVLTKTGMRKWRSAELVDSVFGIIKQTLESGEDVLITGFGKFSVRKKNERRGRNPVTGESMTLASRKVVTFKCGTVLRERLNGKR